MPSSSAGILWNHNSWGYFKGSLPSLDYWIAYVSNRILCWWCKNKGILKWLRVQVVVATENVNGAAQKALAKTVMAVSAKCAVVLENVTSLHRAVIDVAALEMSPKFNVWSFQSVPELIWKPVALPDLRMPHLGGKIPPIWSGGLLRVLENLFRLWGIPLVGSSA